MLKLNIIQSKNPTKLGSVINHFILKSKKEVWKRNRNRDDKFTTSWNTAITICERDDSNAKYMANDEIVGGDESNMNYLITRKKKKTINNKWRR